MVGFCGPLSGLWTLALLVFTRSLPSRLRSVSLPLDSTDHVLRLFCPKSYCISLFRGLAYGLCWFIVLYLGPKSLQENMVCLYVF